MVTEPMIYKAKISHGFFHSVHSRQSVNTALGWITFGLEVLVVVCLFFWAAEAAACQNSSDLKKSNFSKKCHDSKKQRSPSSSVNPVLLLKRPTPNFDFPLSQNSPRVGVMDPQINQDPPNFIIFENRSTSYSESPYAVSQGLPLFHIF